jgi:uncharacterized protein (DUF885 family)
MKMTWRAALLGPLALACCAQPVSAQTKPDDRKLESLFRAYLEETFEAEPLFATRLGDHRFDDRLDDLSPEARAKNLARDRRWLKDLSKELQPDELSRDSQIDLEIFRHHLQRSIWLTENFRPFEEDPRIYGDYMTESVYLPLAQSTLPRDQVIKSVQSRMAHIPRIVDIARRTITKPARVKTETAILQTKGAIRFYEQGLFMLSGQPKGEGLFNDRAEAIVSALKEHLAFLEEEVLPRALIDSWRIGEDRFIRKLEFELNAGISADELLREAESEANRVRREMANVARYLWAEGFRGKPVPPDDEAGRKSLVHLVLDKLAEDHSEPDELIADARATVKEIKRFINRNDILRLPDPDRCRIIEMPEFMRGNSVAFLEFAPPLDPDAPSEYAISPPPASFSPARVKSLLEEYNRSMLRILTIHEAYPGHYVQHEYSNRCPSLIRKALYSGTFSEGWAVYAEQMMLDQGYGAGDLKLRLQQLKFYLRAVVNAILDEKLHCTDMTDEQATDLLVSQAFQTEAEAAGKLIRAKQTSCQLSTYFAGRTAFYRLRQAIAREQGARFELGRFHEAVLGQGPLPVKYLPELARARLKAPR